MVDMKSFISIDAFTYDLKPERFPSPCFVTDVEILRKNARILNFVQERTGVKILLALKAYSQWNCFSYLSRAMNGVLYGACASSLDEARLAKEEFKGEVHAFAAAFSDEEMYELLSFVDHITFNSLNQWKRFRPLILKFNQENNVDIACGLRINPEHSEGTVPIYDPCDPSSRLGIRLREFEKEDSKIFEGLTGIHFHTLCEQNADAFARTLEVVEKKFGHILSKMEWINFGGGHHITREDYDIELLCSCILKVQEKYGLKTYLEPGEAVALNAGYFISKVLDIIEADMPMAIMDCSAACHMPDVMEMPYRPNLCLYPETEFAPEPPYKEYAYRLAGKSCLAGDVIGLYSFDKPLSIGDTLIFQDMAIYSMVKTNTFNGLRLPSIAVWDSKTDEIHAVKNFTYEDFKSRL